MTRGLRVEPELRELYRASVGPVSEPPGLFKHATHPFLAASPDGLGPDGLLVELKTTTIYTRQSWGEPGTDSVPDGYNIQCQQMMALAGCDRCHLLVAFGVDGTEAIEHSPLDVELRPTFAIDSTAVYLLKRDDALCRALEDAAVSFWRDFVETGKPPPGKPMHNIRKWAALLKGQSTNEVKHG